MIRKTILPKRETEKEEKAPPKIEAFVMIDGKVYRFHGCEVIADDKKGD